MECIQQTPSPAAFNTTHAHNPFFGEKYSQQCLAKEKFIFTAANIISKALVLYLKVLVLHKGMENRGEQNPQVPRRPAGTGTYRDSRFQTQTKHQQWQSIFNRFYKETSK